MVSEAGAQGSVTLRLEVFAEDLDRFVDFYVAALGFEISDDRRLTDHPYVAVARGGAVIGASRPWTSVDPVLRHVPQGVELVLEVDDVAAEYARAERSGVAVSDPLEERPWGLTDFRLHDPDGHYVCVTSRG